MNTRIDTESVHSEKVVADRISGYAAAENVYSEKRLLLAALAAMQQPLSLGFETYP